MGGSVKEDTECITGHGTGPQWLKYIKSYTVNEVIKTDKVIILIMLQAPRVKRHKRGASYIVEGYTSYWAGELVSGSRRGSDCAGRGSVSNWG